MSEGHLFLTSFFKASTNALYPGIKHMVNFHDKQENKLNEIANTDMTKVTLDQQTCYTRISEST